MTRAWEIAKAAVVKFGGYAKQYISVALKAAWSEVKGTVMTVKEKVIARLNEIVERTNNRYDTYNYTVSVKEWNNYGKSRTYISVNEYRMKSKGFKYYQKLDFGYIDNKTNEYVPNRKYDAMELDLI